MKKIAFLLPVLALLIAGIYWWQSTSPRHHPRVIALVQLTEVDASTVTGFKAGMEAAGYREGEEVIYLSSGPAGEIDRLDGIIREHLSKKPDLIMVSSTPATQAVKKLTEGMNIPVVFAPVNDPLSAGIVTDLRNPGGHITGIRLPTGDDLRLKWLTEIAPHVRRVFVPYTPGDKSAQTTLDMITAVAPNLGVELITQAVQGKEGVDAALAALPANVDAIFLPRDSSVESHIEAFVVFANTRRLPICAPSYAQVQKGALMSYGFVHNEIGLQAARLADQIFRGEKPGNLPVEMAENLLSINAVTAQRIGLTVSGEIMRQAEIIVRE